MSEPFLHQAMGKFDELLRSRLRAAQKLIPRGGGPEMLEHPDAGQFSAYVENILRPKERAALFEHVAVCPDCRETLFLMVGDRVFQPVSAPRKIGWFWIPAAAALACAILSFPLEQNPARHTAQRKPARVFVPPAAFSVKTDQIILPPPPEIATNAMHVNSGPMVDLPVLPPPPEITVTASAPKLPVEAFGASVAPPPQAVNRPAPVQESVTAESAADRDRARAFNGFVAGAPRMAQSASNSAASLWRLPSEPRSGMVQRSSDQGGSWQDIHVTDGVAFQAVAAFGADVWTGGDSGVLFHSPDSGSHWTRIGVADGRSRLKGAITSLRANSRVEVQIRTSSGEEWTTSDAGGHWKKNQ